MDILHGSSPLPILVKYTPIFVRFVTLPTAALRIRLWGGSSTHAPYTPNQAFSYGWSTGRFFDRMSEIL
jgi:hypothetical protein